jgi:hypothetical protein
MDFSLDQLASSPYLTATIVLLGIVLIGLWVNYRLTRVQKELHELGKGYYAKERDLENELKAGIINEGVYRKRHEQLLREMREESRRIADGPPK